MTSSPIPPRTVRPPRLVIVLAAAVLLLVAGWAMTHLYVNNASGKCLALYREARSAADTARVDSIVPAGQSKTGLGQVNCRFIRTKARSNRPVSGAADTAR